MALTRPTIYNLNTNIEVFNDSITVLNAAATSPTTDVGFVFNRAHGLVPNAATYWSESLQSFEFVLTNSNGAPNSNIAIQSYANVSVGNLLLVQGSILGVVGNLQIGNLTANSGVYGNTASITGNITGGNVLAAGFFYANGSPFVSSSYGNVQMLANLAAAGNPITIGSNLTVGGNVVSNSAVIGNNVNLYSTGGQVLNITGNTYGDGGANTGANALVYINQTNSWSGAQPWSLYVNGYTSLGGFRINASDGIRALYRYGGGTIGIATADSSNITFSTSASATQFVVAQGSSNAVNYVQAVGSATTFSPIVSAQGSDTNISLQLQGKGSGNVFVNSPMTIASNLNVGGNLVVTGNIITVNYETVLYTETANTLIVGGTANVNYGYGTLQVIGNAAISGSATTQTVNLAGGNNLFTYSANLLLWGALSVSVSSGYSDPFGGNTAVQLTDTVSTGSHDINQTPVLTPGNYTFSVYAKASTANYLFLFYSGTNQGVYYNIANGTVYGYYQYQQNGNNPYSIVSAGNGWYRCTMTCSAVAGSGNYWGIYTAESGGNYATGTGLAILVAAPQLESGIIASPYTPTTASAVTTYNNLYIPYGNLAVGSSLQTRTGGNVDINANALVLSSGTTGITTITQTATGNLYTSAPTVTISAPTSQFGGVQATANANIGVVYVGNIQSAGNYYTPGQVITMVGNASTFANATFTVTAVGNSLGGTGNVTGLTVTTSGSYNIANVNPATFTVASGSGTGLQVNVYYGVNQPTITNAGSGYVEQPQITFVGGGGSGAAAYATVGSPNTITATGANLSIVLPQGEVVKFVTSPVILGVINGNLTGANLGVGQYANTALTATALTGNAIAAGGVGIVGNVYGTSRIGFTWVSNSSSAAYTVFNPATSSIDTYFN